MYLVYCVTCRSVYSVMRDAKGASLGVAPSPEDGRVLTPPLNYDFANLELRCAQISCTAVCKVIQVFQTTYPFEMMSGTETMPHSTPLMGKCLRSLTPV
jgi:hypothetical protein